MPHKPTQVANIGKIGWQLRESIRLGKKVDGQTDGQRDNSGSDKLSSFVDFVDKYPPCTIEHIVMVNDMQSKMFISHTPGREYRSEKNRYLTS